MHACIHTREKTKITVSVCSVSSHNWAINKVRKCWKQKVRYEVPNEKTHLSCSILFQFFKDSKSEGQSSFRTIEKKNWTDLVFEKLLVASIEKVFYHNGPRCSLLRFYSRENIFNYLKQPSFLSGISAAI